MTNTTPARLLPCDGKLNLWSNLISRESSEQPDAAARGASKDIDDHARGVVNDRVAITDGDSPD